MTDEERKQAHRWWSHFSGLPRDHAAVQALVKSSQPRGLAPADVLVNETEEDGTVFLVISGLLRAVRYTANGHEVWHADVKPGDVAGDMAALTGGRRTSSVVASDACVVLAISPEAFLSVAALHADFALALARMLASRLQVTSTRLAELASLSVSTRLHSELAAMGAPTLRDEEAFEIETPPRVLALSQRIYATREATSRALADLEQRGLLIRSRSAWTVIVAAEFGAVPDAQPTGSALPPAQVPARRRGMRTTAHRHLLRVA